MPNIKSSDYMDANIALNYAKYKKELKEQKIELSYKPVVVYLAVTSKCNMKPRCVMCLTTKKDRDIDDLLINNIKRDILPYALSVTYTALGEPTTYSKIVELVLNTSGWVNLQTNGINRETINELIPYLHEIYFSIDAANDEMYRKIRGVKYHTVIESIKDAATIRDLKNENMFIRLDFVIMQMNKYQILDFVKHAKDLGANGVSFTRLYQLGNYTNRNRKRGGVLFNYEENIISLSDDDVNNMLHQAKLFCNNNNMNFKVMQ